MKDILFVIDSLTCGGAEKSLISLLNNIDYSLYNVDILLIRRGGEFEKFLPKEVNLLESPDYFKFLTGEYVGSIKNKVKYLVYRYKTSLKLRLNNISKKNIYSEQIVYLSVKNILSKVNKKYNSAIAYSQGFPTYFIAEKVNAYKKLAWINCNYVETKYNKDIDNIFYNNIDRIVVVSQNIYDSIANMGYNYKNKMIKILDIVDSKLIMDMALQEKAIEFNEVEEFKILTVGRLEKIKGYDLAIRTTSLLKKNNYKVKWFAIGEGNERGNLESLINEYDVKEEFILLGGKTNPYTYMNKCDLYVQTSRSEGFGLTVMEAKILKNVIITTNFNTASELIVDKVDGLIVNKKETSIFNTIKKLIDKPNVYNRIKKNIIESKIYDSVSEINKFYKEISE